jgi:hypothetical protein
MQFIQLTIASPVENSMASLIIVVKVFTVLIFTAISRTPIQSYVLHTEYYVEADD